MNFNFSTSGVEATREKQLTPWISEPGVYNCKFWSFETEVTDRGPVVTLNWVTDPVEGLNNPDYENGQTFKQTFRLTSDAAFKFFMSRFALLADHAGVRKEVDAIQSESAEEYFTKASRAFSGKRIALIIKGRQYLKADGTVGTSYELPLKGEFKGSFCRPVDRKSELDELVLQNPDNLVERINPNSAPDTTPKVDVNDDEF